MKKVSFLNKKMIAYRGVYDNERIYENTIASIERAIKNELPVCLDVKLLKDGNIVLYGDSTLDRMLHVEEKIESITLNDLNYYAKYKIPTLEEALVCIQGKIPVIINVRCKSKKHLIENRLVSFLKNYPGKVAIQSNDLNMLKYIHKLNKDLIIGYVMNKRNYYNFILFHDYNYIAMDSILVSDKHAKKIKEDYFIIGYGIQTKEQYLSKQNSYDALICDNVLAIKK